MKVNPFKKLWLAMGYSFCGLAYAFKEEFAFRLEVIVSIFAVPIALYFGKTAEDQCLLLLSWFSILVIELLNSAIENTINRIGPEKHPLSKRAKDMGSAAVFVACLIASAVWWILLVEPLFQF